MLSVQDIQPLRPSEQFLLDGRVALVTGASGGIGSWLAAGLGAAGASVMLTGRDGAALQELERVLRAADIEVCSVALDLLEPDAPGQLVASTIEAFGRLDVLVNNAGINRRKPIVEATRKDFDEVIALDLKTPYFLAQAVVRQLADSGRGGAVINISSINSFHGLEDVSLYGAAKGGLNQLTRVMALEWARLNIRVNAIAPGFIYTPLASPLWEDPGASEWLQHRVPLGRLGQPRELVGLCQLLGSDAGSFITGQTFIIDGGLLAGNSWLTRPPQAQDITGNGEGPAA